MAEKPYSWASGATLEDHSRRKHKILREYFANYLGVRCQLPQQTQFRLAIVDGFAGGGRYACGTPGSPLIFIEELRRAIDTINTMRAAQGFGLVSMECLLVLNDQSPAAIDSVNRRPKRTPYRRPKGTPFVEQRDGYVGCTVRAGCGVGRA
jgi:three-Cys-motif partner protein